MSLWPQISQASAGPGCERPDELRGCFIGHLVHEKRADLFGSEKYIQNAMITSAANWYLTGRPTLWDPLDIPRHRI
jgi:hypothetical protein